MLRMRSLVLPWPRVCPVLDLPSFQLSPGLGLDMPGPDLPRKSRNTFLIDTLTQLLSCQPTMLPGENSIYSCRFAEQSPFWLGLEAPFPAQRLQPGVAKPVVMLSSPRQSQGRFGKLPQLSPTCRGLRCARLLVGKLNAFTSCLMLSS